MKPRKVRKNCSILLIKEIKRKKKLHKNRVKGVKFLMKNSDYKEIDDCEKEIVVGNETLYNWEIINPIHPIKRVRKKPEWLED